jgi:O-methyltransferase
MNIKRLFLNKYVDRWVFRHLSPQLHAGYKLLRHGTYDSERLAMYRRAVLWLNVNGVQGSVCEFGCSGGESFLNLYFQFSKQSSVCPHFYLFDSFEGLPDLDARTPHSGWKRGDFRFSYEDLLKRMEFFGVPRKSYSITRGFFDKSLTRETWHALDIGPVSLLHIDCDLYDSSLLSLNFVSGNLQDGTVILFDDYYCSRADMKMGESGAFQEWLSQHPEWTAVPWHDYSIHGKAFLLSRAAM